MQVEGSYFEPISLEYTPEEQYGDWRYNCAVYTELQKLPTKASTEQEYLIMHVHWQEYFISISQEDLISIKYTIYIIMLVLLKWM